MSITNAGSVADKRRREYIFGVDNDVGINDVVLVVLVVLVEG